MEKKYGIYEFRHPPCPFRLHSCLWVKKKFILTNPALPLTSVSGRDLHHLTVVEIIYIVFSFGFILDEFAASKEHGWAGTFWLGYLIHESVGSRLINQMCKQSMLQM